MPEAGRSLILGCGALARELLEIVNRNGLDNVDVDCLPASLHNHPDRIAPAIDARLAEVAAQYDRILIGYADCGTVGALDEVAIRYGAEMLPGAHCYEFYATSEVFARLHDDEPGTFYLTDYLVRHFDRIVIHGLGLDRHPQLRDDYFGNYRRLVYLAQSVDEGLVVKAKAAAERLDLELEVRQVGMGDLEPAVVELGLPEGR